MRAGLESGQQWHRCPISTSSARTAATRSAPTSPSVRTAATGCASARRRSSATARSPSRARPARRASPPLRGCRASARARSPASAASSRRAPTPRSRSSSSRCSATCCSSPWRWSTSASPRPIDGQWWRVATSPFLYGSIWYELAAVTAIAVFGWLLERRHGPLVVARPLRAVRDGRHRAGRRRSIRRRWRSAATARRSACCARGPSRTSSRAAAARSTTATCSARRSSPRSCCSCPWRSLEASAIAGFAGGAAGLLVGLVLARARIA